MMTEVRCSPHIPDVPNLPQQELSVGRHFYLSCEGTWDREFDFSKAAFLLDPQQPPVWKLFKAEARDLNTFEVDLTVYQAGKLEIKDLILTDGVKQISLGHQSFEVASKIQKSQIAPNANPNSESSAPGQPQPFSYKYFDLQWPVLYTLLLVIAVLVILGLSAFLIYTRNKFRKLLRTLKDYESALEPDTQFYRELRRLEKLDYPVAELKQVIYTYLTRTFHVPFFGMVQKQALRYFKKKYPQHKELRRQLFQLLKDVDIVVVKNEATSKHNLVQQAYKFIDRTEEIKSQGGLHE